MSTTQKWYEAYEKLTQKEREKAVCMVFSEVLETCRNSKDYRVFTNDNNMKELIAAVMKYYKKSDAMRGA